MVTGLMPSRHRFLFNRIEEYPPDTYVSGTMLDAVHAAGRTTALYVSKQKLRILAKPEVLNRQIVTDTGRSDEVVAAFLEDLAAGGSGGWDLTVIHLVEPDVVGHAKGWMSRDYQHAVQIIDEEIGRIIGALEQRQVLSQTLVLITADHGGIWRNHRLHISRVLHVPWIALGPPELSGGKPLERSVGPCDIVPTILSALGLPIPAGLDGSPVF